MIKRTMISASLLLAILTARANAALPFFKADQLGEDVATFEKNHAEERLEPVSKPA